jgi:hypothetical protein
MYPPFGCEQTTRQDYSNSRKLVGGRIVAPGREADRLRLANSEVELTLSKQLCGSSTQLTPCIVPVVRSEEA